MNDITRDKKIWEMIQDIVYYYFLDSRKPHSLESVLCGPRWASKTPAVLGFYKRCTPWLELETCCADLKPFAITLRSLGTRVLYIASTRYPIIR
jgi:hypothetical protein